MKWSANYTSASESIPLTIFPPYQRWYIYLSHRRLSLIFHLSIKPHYYLPIHIHVRYMWEIAYFACSQEKIPNFIIYIWRPLSHSFILFSKALVSTVPLIPLSILFQTFCHSCYFFFDSKWLLECQIWTKTFTWAPTTAEYRKKVASSI